MTIGYWLPPEDSSCEFHNSQWNHSSSLKIYHTTKSSLLNAWAFSRKAKLRRKSVPGANSRRAPYLQSQNRRWVSSDHGSFGFGCGVRNSGVVPPRIHGSFAQPSPREMETHTKDKRELRWQREHILLTSKHLPDRAPLPDKGKPVVRRGRKATDQISHLRAGLPEEE